MELKKIFGSKWDEMSRGGENYITKNFMVCAIPHQIFLCLNQEDGDKRSM